jgi:hypothetical protein
VESSDFAASLEARREMWLATSSSRSPNDGRGVDLAKFHWHLDAFLLSITLERVTIERFMLARECQTWEHRGHWRLSTGRGRTDGAFVGCQGDHYPVTVREMRQTPHGGQWYAKSVSNLLARA